VVGYWLSAGDGLVVDYNGFTPCSAHLLVASTCCRPLKDDKEMNINLSEMNLYLKLQFI